MLMKASIVFINNPYEKLYYKTAKIAKYVDA